MRSGTSKRMGWYDYHVVTRWSVEATLNEVADIFLDTASLSRWWRAAFLSVRILEPGSGNTVGQVACLHTKGWLPYTLRFDSTVIEAIYPDSFTVLVRGDFQGRCMARFYARGSCVELVF